ncbi:hypothetical protein [Anaerotruncus sp. 1XD42-93]|uniref:hypothetical protein n=1 Tax=Anaerotruncus sp. 1XD42-93 TaxID=2320853 RepID=UPI000EA31A90|nr:hypothetical protein [Anaerotruncus sp. 1XD42-93]NBH80549.1 hypothetical protein [Clostridiaceae bacterium]NBI58648.1 hypothetical protein [Lachnospiraceae bacterium]RKJ49974.1 hypothetical protein D7X25_18785 [bacterium 1XD42-8]RKJ82779.1 hypothetical protein D7Y41_23215 [Anaerotruncus sp. 1XD22-93]NBK19092.1 hypothetical protein [Anaerotruncus sp. 1XD42-93]
MIRKIGTVQHINLVTGWEYPKQHEIFCKKEHKLKSVNPYDCEKCPYFVTAERMDAIVCQWEDTLAAGDYATKIIRRYDSYEEFLRVSELIASGVLKEG